MTDQIFANGFSFAGLAQSQFGGKGCFWRGCLVMASKAVARPSMQITTGFFNNNLFGKNLRKWGTICYLNTARMLTLPAINYYSREDEDFMHYFNVCYYGFVGYLMYLETYTL